MTWNIAGEKFLGFSERNVDNILGLKNTDNVTLNLKSKIEMNVNVLETRALPLEKTRDFFSEKMEERVGF